MLEVEVCVFDVRDSVGRATLLETVSITSAAVAVLVSFVYLPVLFVESFWPVCWIAIFITKSESLAIAIKGRNFDSTWLVELDTEIGHCLCTVEGFHVCAWVLGILELGILQDVVACADSRASQCENKVDDLIDPLSMKVL